MECVFYPSIRVTHRRKKKTKMYEAGSFCGKMECLKYYFSSPDSSDNLMLIYQEIKYLLVCETEVQFQKMLHSPHLNIVNIGSPSANFSYVGQRKSVQMHPIRNTVAVPCHVLPGCFSSARMTKTSPRITILGLYSQSLCFYFSVALTLCHFIQLQYNIKSAFIHDDRNW